MVDVIPREKRRLGDDMELGALWVIPVKAWRPGDGKKVWGPGDDKKAWGLGGGNELRSS